MEMMRLKLDGSWKGSLEGDKTRKEKIADDETIKLMKAHSFSSSLLRSKKFSKTNLEEILTAGQMASSWKNFQSIQILVRSQKRRKILSFMVVPQEPFASQLHSCSLLWPKPCRKKEQSLHTDTQPQGVEGLLITYGCCACWAKYCLRLRVYGGVIGLVRYKSEEVAELFNLPDIPFLGLHSVCLNQQHDVKPRRLWTKWWRRAKSSQ